MCLKCDCMAQNSPIFVFLMEVVHILYNDCLWCVDEKEVFELRIWA